MAYFKQWLLFALLPTVLVYYSVRHFDELAVVCYTSYFVFALWDPNYFDSTVAVSAVWPRSRLRTICHDCRSALKPVVPVVVVAVGLLIYCH